MTSKEVESLKRLYKAVCDVEGSPPRCGGPLKRGVGGECYKTFGPRGEILIEWGTTSIGSFVTEVYNEFPQILRILEENINE